MTNTGADLFALTAWLEQRAVKYADHATALRKIGHDDAAAVQQGMAHELRTAIKELAAR